MKLELVFDAVKYKEIDSENQSRVLSVLSDSVLGAGLAGRLLASADRTSHSHINLQARLARCREYLDNYVPIYREEEKHRIIPELLYVLMFDCGRITAESTAIESMAVSVLELAKLKAGLTSEQTAILSQLQEDLTVQRYKDILDNVTKATFTNVDGIRWYCEYLLYNKEVFDPDKWFSRVVNVQTVPTSILTRSTQTLSYYKDNVDRVLAALRGFYFGKANNGLAYSINVY